MRNIVRFVHARTSFQTPLLVLLFTSVILGIPIFSSAQGQALVARYSMDEGSGSILVDSSAGNNNGVLVAGPGWVSGVRGQALSLNGTSQYAAVGDAANLDISNAITMAAWISPTKTAAATARVICKALMTTTNGYELSLAASGKVFVRFNQATSGDTYRINSISNYPLNTGVWMHVAATYDGATMRLYINGIEEASLTPTVPFTIGTNDDSLYIGRQKGGTPYYYQGKLDEARVYNYALGASEVLALSQHIIAAGADANGSISPSGNIAVNHDGSQTFAITPNFGFHIADVLVDGSSVGAIPSYTFTNVLFDHTISASFAINTYTIVASAGSHGTISPEGNVIVNYGANQIFSITPEVGYHVADVLVDGSSVGPVESYTFTGVSENHSISASFAINTYTIVASAGLHGTITPSGNVIAEYGSDQGFLIEAEVGYHITDVLVDGISVGALSSYTFTDIALNHSIAASFAVNTFSIIASAGLHGSITPSGTIVVNYGDNQSFSISADLGYHILDLLVDGSSVGPLNSYTFTAVNGNHTISATFAINTFTITSSAGANGSISPLGDISVEYGADQTFDITANPGYHISNVIVDGVSIGSPSSHTFSDVTTDHTISASFAINSYIITASAGSHGSIMPSGNIVADYGTDLYLSFTPDPGYHIADVLVDGSSIGTPTGYTFNDISDDHTISVSFAVNTFIIVASAGPNGSISPAGSVPVNYGDDQFFEINANTGYHIADVVVDGVSIGAVPNHTFYDVDGNHTIMATFAIDVFTIVASSGPYGSISPSGNINVNYGDNQAFNISANAGYHVADVLVDGISVGAPSSYSFDYVTSNHTIIASFIANVTDMVGHWAIEESGGSIIIDSTAYLNHGTLVNSPSRVPGVRGQALMLNGTNQYATAGDSASIDITNAITLMAWIKPEKQGTQYILKKARQTGTPGVDDGYELALASLNSSDPPYGDGRAFVRFNQCTSQNTYRLNTLTQYPFDGNTWVHLAATYDGATIRIYYNGIEENSRAASIQINSNNLPLGIGAQGDGTSPIDGAIDDVRLYNYALSASEIRQFASHIITASAGANGTISPSGAVSVLHGRDTTFAITPNLGYHIVDVLVDGSSVGAVNSYVFSGVNADHTISAVFAIDTFTITASAGPNGAIDPQGSIVVNYGSSQSFSIVPITGYHVADVVIDGNPQGPMENYTFNTVTANHSIHATFAINTYTLSASAGPNGAINPAGDVVVNYGSNQVFSFVANSCYHILNVLVDGVSIGVPESYTFTNVTSNHTISVTFAINTYTIAAFAGSGGTITPSGNVIVNCGADQSFLIAPNQGYHIADVTVDGISMGPVASYTFSAVNSNHSIEALFAINTYVISATAGPGGSISPSGDIVVNYGADQVFNILPNTGYHVLDVIIDGISAGPLLTYTFTAVESNHTIIALFAITEFSITATAGEGGSIYPSGVVYVTYGSSQTFDIVPDIGHYILNVMVDGGPVGPVDSYTFDNITTNHTIEATFGIYTYIISASAAEGGTITPSGDIVVTYGSSQNFCINCNSGHHVDDVVVDGNSQGALSSYLFDNITADHTIHAEFGDGEIPHIISIPDTITEASEVYLYQVVATGTPQPTYSLVISPSYMVIDYQTGVITWFPEVPGLYAVTVAATNVAGVDYQNFNIQVGGCSYVVGDINNSNVLNGLDVTYGVAFFKGGHTPPYYCDCNGSIWFVSGDVNASCNFNGIDITYLVSFFKGGPIPEPCPACEPILGATKLGKLEEGAATKEY